jgi:hypothetical protein
MQIDFEPPALFLVLGLAPPANENVNANRQQRHKGSDEAQDLRG